ncbi:MAG: hypothetical protein M1814_003483 [Vezdaea aestivalis]|nr:MAG: hypothetical protein M1814_003483 [Vezdaea aestivalis]
MARSLDKLIDHIIAEIALHGNTGLEKSEVDLFILKYLGAAELSQSGNFDDALDRKFLDRVWTWLNSNKEIWIRPGKETEVLEGKPSNPDSLKARGFDVAPDGGPTRHALPRGLSPGQNGAIQVSGTREVVYTSHFQVWKTLTGHGPDLTRCPKFEFQLLSIIAHSGETGILQPELVRVSGQDKRSVPGRTTSLQEKGYIEKRAVYNEGQKTSLLRHVRFIAAGPKVQNVKKSLDTQSESNGTAEDAAASLLPANEGSTYLDTEVVDIKELLQGLFEILKKWQVITYADLKKKMGVYGHRRRTHRFNRVIRKLECTGCLSRIDAKGELGHRGNWRCIKFHRMPEDGEWNMSLDLKVAGTSKSERQEANELVTLDPFIEPAKTDSLPSAIVQSMQWSPDKPFINTIFNVVASTGPKGITTVDIRRCTVGNFFLRPLDTLMQRYTELWDVVQPKFLRHLTMVRDKASVGRTSHHLYLTHSSFDLLVQKGETEWEAIGKKGGLKEGEKGKSNIFNAHIADKTDEFGFADFHNVSFGSAANPGTVFENDTLPGSVRSRIPQIAHANVFHEDGLPVVRWVKSRNPNTKRMLEEEDLSLDSGERSAKRAKPNVPKRPRGRPRKYPHKVGHSNLQSELNNVRSQTASTDLIAALPLNSFIRIDRTVLPKPGQTGRRKKGLLLLIRSEKLRQLNLNASQPLNENIAEETVSENNTMEVNQSASLPSHPTRDGNSAASTTAELRDPPMVCSSLKEQSISRKPRKTSSLEFESRIATRRQTAICKRAIDQPEAPDPSIKRLKDSDNPSPPSSTPTGSIEIRQPDPVEAMELEVAGEATSDAPAAPMPEEDAGETQSQLADTTVTTERLLSEQKAVHQLKPTEVEMPMSDQNSLELVVTASGEALPRITVDDDSVAQTNTPKTSHHGGSALFKRKKAIMNVVNRNQGIFSGDKNLYYEWCLEMQRVEPHATIVGLPDFKTYKTAENALTLSGTLKVLKFTFKSLQGIVTTRTILAVSTIQPTGKEVQELQKSIIENGGVTKVPERLALSARYRGSINRKSFPILEVGSMLKEDVQIHAPQPRRPSLKRKRQTSLEQDVINNMQNRLNEEDERNPTFTAEEKAKAAASFRSGGRYLGLVQRLSSQDVGGLASAKAPTSSQSATLSPFVAPTQPPLPQPSISALHFGNSAKSLWLPRSGDSITASTSTSAIDPQQRKSRKVDSISVRSQSATNASLENLDHTSSGIFGAHTHSVQTRLKSAGQFDTADSAEVFQRHEAVQSSDGVRRSNAYNPNSIWAFQPSTSFGHDTTAKTTHALDEFQQTELAARDTSILYPDSSRSNFASASNARKAHHNSQGAFSIDQIEETANYKSLEVTNGVSIPSKVGDIQTRSDSQGFKTRQLFSREEAGLGAELRQLSFVTGKKRVKPTEEDEHDDDEDTQSKFCKKRRIRGPQMLKHLTPDLIERLTFAVIVIRTLTGGIERHIDWVLISSLFPDYTQDFIIRRWPSIFQRSRAQIEQMQTDFQDEFLRAYGEKTVPVIDFDDLLAYDWMWLIEWAMEKLESTTDGKFHLPTSRTELDNVFNLVEDRGSLGGAAEDYFALSTTQARRTRIGADEATCQKMIAEPGLEILDADEIAQSWVRANIVAEPHSYDALQAQEKLMELDEAILQGAIKNLEESKAILHVNKGREAPGRSYQFTDKFQECFKRYVGVENFADIALAQKEFDMRIKEFGLVEYNDRATDIDVSCMLNAVACRRVDAVEVDVTSNKFGLIGGGYKTRTMDKIVLNFDVSLRVMDGFKPLAADLSFSRPPPGEPESGCIMNSTPCPLWYDIHGRLLSTVWSKTYWALSFVVALRPGITLGELALLFHPRLCPWEMNLILQQQ